MAVGMEAGRRNMRRGEANRGAAAAGGAVTRGVAKGGGGSGLCGRGMDESGERSIDVVPSVPRNGECRFEGEALSPEVGPRCR